MTKSTRKALKAVGIPAVRWSDQYQQYFARIGYRKTRLGKRQRAFHYLGKDEQAAVAEAVKLKMEWRELKRKAKTFLAVWPDTLPALATLTAAETQAEVNRVLIEASEDSGEEPQRPTLRIEQVKELYLEYRKSKVGVGGGEGLKQGTFNADAANLKQALAHTDATQTIDTFTFVEIERLKDAIFRKVPAELTQRTAINYLRSLKGMLDFAHRRTDIPYRHPEDFTTLFEFRNFKGTTKIAPYDATQLKQLLSKATDRERLYIYLALNCGHTQVDIGNLRQNEIITYQGQPSIIRKRDKTSHQNDFESMHTLWPETYVLLIKEPAKPNKGNFALLNSNGKPLYSIDSKGRYDAIGDTYGYLTERSKVTLSFKQFRKIGATAMERIAGKQARRLYKAGSIDSGDTVYVIDCYDNLTPPLLKWGEELRKDGVLY